MKKSLFWLLAYACIVHLFCEESVNFGKELWKIVSKIILSILAAIKTSNSAQ